MPHVQVFAGHTNTSDTRPPSVKDHGEVASQHVSELLWEIGLEFKSADYFLGRKVIIVIDPDEGDDPKDAMIERLMAAVEAAGVPSWMAEKIRDGS